MAKHYTAGSLTGNDMRHIRLGLLLTQRELAHKLGYAHKIRISEFERSRNPVPIPLPIQEEMIRLYTTGGEGTPGTTAVREWVRKAAA
jgi:transcriptional regulator with XRE-family HTH domain